MNLSQKYNIHKRRTLDRITAKHHYHSRKIIKKAFEDNISEIKQALDSGSNTFSPGLKGFDSGLTRIYENHRENIIHVGVSDGIQEVTPKHELDLWMNAPLLAPIEDTLSISLRRDRDEYSSKISEIVAKRKKGVIADMLLSSKEKYVHFIKQSYGALAKDWLQGESSVKTIKDRLSEAFAKTDSHINTIFRTETTSYFNESRHEYFKTATLVDYEMLFALTDGRVSKICEDRHGYVIHIDDGHLKIYMPPFHPNCRTIKRALMSKLKRHKALIDKGLRMNESGFTKLPKGWA